MTDDGPEEDRPRPQRPAPRRPVRQRPAPRQVTAPARSRRRRSDATAAGTPVPPVSDRPARPSRRPRELPRAFWLALVAEVTLIVILLADWLTGWGDPPADCSRSICSTGQGVGLLALVGAVLIGICVVVSFFVIAVGAAQRQSRQPRGPRTR